MKALEVGAHFWAPSPRDFFLRIHCEAGKLVYQNNVTVHHTHNLPVNTLQGLKGCISIILMDPSNTAPMAKFPGEFIYIHAGVRVGVGRYLE